MDELKIPVLEIAEQLGQVRVANMVALGALVQRSRIVSSEVLKKSVREEFRKHSKMISLNLDALEAGMRAAGEN